MSSWPPTKYKTTNWSSYNDALRQRGSLSFWFDPEMVWTPPPSGRRGRQQCFNDAAIHTCLTLKVLFGMPLRQTAGFAESLLRLVGLDWAVPDFSTLCRRQKTLNVRLPYRGGTGPLNLLIPLGHGCAMPCRPVNALCEADGATPHGEGLRPASCGKPSPHCRPQSLRRSWHTRHGTRRISLPGGRGKHDLNRICAIKPVPGNASSKPPNPLSGNKRRRFGAALNCTGSCRSVRQQFR